MRPSFRKKSIKLVHSVRALFRHPALLKIILLLILFSGALSFKIRASKLQESVARPGVTPRAAVLASPAPSPPAPHKTAPSGQVHINTASMDELATLPGIGPKLAEVIKMYREENGPFHDEKDLLGIRGIGAHRAHRIAPYLNFDGSS